MEWIYRTTDDDRHRFALGEVQEKPGKLLFVFGINPSNATPQKLDPTVKRMRKIALEHGYDSWVALNVCSQRSTNPDGMEKVQNLDLHQENLKIICELLDRYNDCGDVLFAYGDLINKREYLKENLHEIEAIIVSKQYADRCYCLGKTKSGNARHPLYQRIDTPFIAAKSSERK